MSDLPTYRIVFLAVTIVGADCCFATATHGQQPWQVDSVATAMIGPEGGTIELPGVAAVTFPPGAFDVPQQVTLRTTGAPATDQGRTSLDVGGAGLGPFLPYDVRVEAPTLPSTNIDVALQLPGAFVDSLPDGCHPRPLILRVGGGGGESLTMYLDVEALMDPVSNVLRFTILEPWDPYGRGMLEEIVVGADPAYGCAT